jgi:hypothetical protein
MEDMRRTLKVIYFASQLCGISPYGSFLINDGYEQPVLCRKYLVYSIILLTAASVGQLYLGIRLFTGSTDVSSDASRVNKMITLVFLACFLTTYLVSAISRLIGVRNFFKICRKLLSVASFVNYREGSTYSKAVIALHFVLFFSYLFRYFIHCLGSNYEVDMLLCLISVLICDTVISFAAVQFLYFGFTLRRYFMVLNSSLNEVVMSTVKSVNIFPLKVRKVSQFSPKSYSVISGLRYILYHHAMLCDILELIDSCYSFQVLAFIVTKFIYPTIFLYKLFASIFERSLLPVNSFATVITCVIYEVMQLVAVVYCCKSASFQVSVIYEYNIHNFVLLEDSFVLRHFFLSTGECE